MSAQTRLLFLALFFTLDVNPVTADKYGDSLVNNAINKAKETVCKTIDGTIIDNKACDGYTKNLRENQNDNQALEMYHAAVDKLSAYLKESKDSLSQFMMGSKSEDPVGGGYEYLKLFKNKLSTAANDVNSAFSNLGTSQTYVGDAQRWLMSVYNDFLQKLKLVGVSDEDFVEKDFEGNIIAGDLKQGEDQSQDDNDEHGNEAGSKNINANDIYESLQDAYERVSQAASLALEKAYAKVNELGKEAYKATIGTDDPLELSSDKAQKAFGDTKQKAVEVLSRAKDAGAHLAEERLHGHGEQSKDIHDGGNQPKESNPADGEPSANQSIQDSVLAGLPFQESIETATESVETATSSRFDPERQNKLPPGEELGTD